MRQGNLERDSIRRSGGLPPGAVTAAITNISAGTTLATGPSIVFSNSNNVSFGVNGNTVTASVAAAGGLIISAGTGTISTGVLSFRDINEVSWFLQTGGAGTHTMSITVDAFKRITVHNLTGGTQTIGTLAAGTLQLRTDSGDVGWAVSENGLINASYLGKRISYTENYRMADMLNGDFLIGSVLLQHFVLPANRLDATQMDLMVNISNSASAGATLSYRVGIYTLSGSTASLASSASRVLSYNSTLGGSSSYTNVSNWRMHSIALGTWSMTPGDYLLAFWVSTASALTNGSYSFRNGRNLTNLAEPHSTGNYSKYWNAMGAFASTTANLPGSIHLSQHIVTFATNVEVPQYPWVQIAGTF